VAKGYPDWATDVIQHEGTTFVVTGNVDANVMNSVLDVNVTNSQLDVNVTNSVLDVSVQGTANVEIQNAELNVKTLRERASESGDIDFAETMLNLTSNTSDLRTLYENTTNSTVYLEAVYAAEEETDTFDETCAVAVILIRPDGSQAGLFVGNVQNFPMNFDPAIPLAPGAKVMAQAARWSNLTHKVQVTALLRTV